MGPIHYQLKINCEGKAHIALFLSSLSCAVHLKLLPNWSFEWNTLWQEEDNPGKYWSVGWEEIAGIPGRTRNPVAFQLVQSPMVGRAIWASNQHGKAGLVQNCWSSYFNLVLDVETQVNRCPLSYIEDNIQLPILVASLFLFQCSNILPERGPWREEVIGLTWAKYLKSCKDQLWCCWTKEYLATLWERHNLKHHCQKFEVYEGDIVLVKSEVKNHGKWPLAMVKAVFPGHDGVVWVVRVKTGKGLLEKPVQHLYPSELLCDQTLHVVL